MHVIYRIPIPDNSAGGPACPTAVPELRVQLNGMLQFIWQEFKIILVAVQSGTGVNTGEGAQPFGISSCHKSQDFSRINIAPNFCKECRFPAGY